MSNPPNSITKLSDNSAFAQYTVHPIAARYFPLIDGEEFDKLVADIKARGLDKPILVRGNIIIDGRNRNRACFEAGVAPRYEEINPAIDEAGIIDLILAANLFRRHLTTGQRAMIVTALLPSYEAAAKERQRDHGGTAPGKKNTCLKSKTSDSGRTDKQLAAIAKVSPATMYKAKVLLKPGNEDLAEPVRNGSMAIDGAWAKARKKKTPDQSFEYKPKRTYPKIIGRKIIKCPVGFREELVTKLTPVIKELRYQGRQRMVTISIESIAQIAEQLQKMLDEWCA